MSLSNGVYEPCAAVIFFQKDDAVNTILSCVIINNLLTMRGNYSHDPFTDEDGSSSASSEDPGSDNDMEGDPWSIRDALAAHLASLAIQ